MKRGDIKIIVGVVLLVLISYGVVFVKGMGVDQKRLRITQNQVVLHEVILSEGYEKTFMIQEGETYNNIYVKAGEVWIEEANCANQVCVHHAPISEVGETIVCIPHKLIIEIIGENQRVDVIVD